MKKLIIFILLLTFSNSMTAGYLYEKCINRLKIQENLRLKLYKCPSGYPTVGYGHRIKKKLLVKRISRSFAEYLLKKDFNEHIKIVKSKFNNKPAEEVYALALFSFNMGSKKALQIPKNYTKSYLKNKLSKYIYYKCKKTKEYKISQNLINARRFEISLLEQRA